jgi:hypothetical protein
VILNQVPLNDVALVWQALGIPYMLCVPYAVRVALVDSETQVGGARVVAVDSGVGAKAPQLAGTGP